MIDSFTIRVYGILINEFNQILLVDEKTPDLHFTKFPGGGLEFYEGIEDCLIREFKEETGLDIKINQHLYTTGFFVQSAFKRNNQLIAIYYLVEPISDWRSLSLEEQEITINGKKEILRFFWIDKAELNEDIITFPVDKFVVKHILPKLN
jgi:ADP-ribose pyrophosphatase YjhB (NUDIX family)